MCGSGGARNTRTESAKALSIPRAAGKAEPLQFNMLFWRFFAIIEVVSEEFSRRSK